LPAGASSEPWRSLDGGLAFGFVLLGPGGFFVGGSSRRLVIRALGLPIQIRGGSVEDPRLSWLKVMRINSGFASNKPDTGAQTKKWTPVFR